MRSRRNISLESDFYCTCCGKRGVPIPRRRGSAREAGHLKKIYCLNCKEEKNHAEVKECTHYSYKDFRFEFDYGNFSEDGTRVLPYNEFRTKMNKEGIELP